MVQKYTEFKESSNDQKKWKITILCSNFGEIQNTGKKKELEYFMFV